MAGIQLVNTDPYQMALRLYAVEQAVEELRNERNSPAHVGPLAMAPEPEAHVPRTGKPALSWPASAIPQRAIDGVPASAFAPVANTSRVDELRSGHDSVVGTALVGTGGPAAGLDVVGAAIRRRALEDCLDLAILSRAPAVVHRIKDLIEGET